MGPEISTRIAAMLRALDEVIIPAIDNDAKPALEQARLIVGYLRVLAHQHDKIVHYRLKEIREYSALLQRLLVIAGQCSESPAAAAAHEHLGPLQAIADVDLPADAVLRDAAERLRQLSNDLVADLLARNVPALTSEVGHVVTEYARSEILRERSWVLPAGMDPAPDEVPTIDELLSTPVGP